MAYPQPIDFAEIRIGDQLRRTITYTDGSVEQIDSKVVNVSETEVTLSGLADPSPSPDTWTPATGPNPQVSLSYSLLAAHVVWPTEPAVGAVVRVAGDPLVWQRDAAGWGSVDGRRCSWIDLCQKATKAEGQVSQL